MINQNIDRRDSMSSSAKVEPMQAPVNIQRALIGAVLLAAHADTKNPERVMDEVCAVVELADLTDNLSKKAFEVIQSLYEEGRPIDLVSVSSRIATDKLEQGAMIELQKAMDLVPSVDLAQSYARAIKEASDRKKLFDVIEVARKQVLHETNIHPHDQAKGIEDTVSSVFEPRENAQNDLIELKQALGENIAFIDEAYHREDKDAPIGISSGYRDLDEELTGFHDESLIIVAGRPSMGKTSFAIQSAIHGARASGRAPLIFSQEMPAKDLSMRLLGSYSNLGLQSLRKGSIQESDFQKLEIGVSHLIDVPMYIDESSAVTPADIRLRAKKLLRAGVNLGLIVVDYLQLMSSGLDLKSREQEISAISRELKKIARQFHVPVMALSQLNRTLENRANKRPIMADLRESGAIEQDADVILFIYRDKVYNPDTGFPDDAEIIIGKQRNGPIGTVRLHYEERNSQFTDHMYAAASNY